MVTDDKLPQKCYHYFTQFSLTHFLYTASERPFTTSDCKTYPWNRPFQECVKICVDNTIAPPGLGRHTLISVGAKCWSLPWNASAGWDRLKHSVPPSWRLIPMLPAYRRRPILPANSMRAQYDARLLNPIITLSVAYPTGPATVLIVFAL